MASKMSKEARARLSKQMKARWAKVRKLGKSTLGDEKKWGKEAQQRAAESDDPQQYEVIFAVSGNGAVVQLMQALNMDGIDFIRIERR